MMEITLSHPVYVEGKGWVEAEKLAVGDRLHRADGGWAKVLAVEWVKLAEPEPVYNFTVKGPHTYFVLEVGVLVHNTTACEFNPATQRFHATESVNINGKQYQKGNFIPKAQAEIFDEELQQTLKYDEELDAWIDPVTGAPRQWIDSQTGQLAILPNELPQSSMRWSQQLVSDELYWKKAGREIPISDAAEQLSKELELTGKVERETVELTVFRKTPAMDQWPMNVHKERYTGDWSRLENGVIHSINNRSFTVVTMAQIEETGIPVRWATKVEIKAAAFQNSAVEFGKYTKLPWAGENKWLDLTGNIVDRPDLDPYLMFYGDYRPDWFK